MSMWRERQLRDTNENSVSTLVNDKVLEENRYYVISIVEMVQFLATNELPFRGTYDSETQNECGLFTAFYEYTLKKIKS